MAMAYYYGQNNRNLLVFNQYNLLNKIHGAVYLAFDNKNNEFVAAKVEFINTISPCLHIEYELYQRLRGCAGIPRVRWYGRVAAYNILIMDFVGPTLDYLFMEVCFRNFSPETIVMLAYQMISRLELVHRNTGYIHRDLKARNFLVRNGGDADGVVFLIDFGMAQQYINPTTGDHIRYQGNEQSRRDDLESLGYVLLYFICGGRLPWAGIKGATRKQFREKVEEKKRSVSIEHMCAGFPLEWAMFSYLQYCRNLSFDETPDYDHLRKLFYSEVRKPLNYDDLDWIKRRKYEQHMKQFGAFVPTFRTYNFVGPIVNVYTPPANAPTMYMANATSILFNDHQCEQIPGIPAEHIR